MKVDMKTLDGKKAGSIELADEIFGLDPRADLIQRVVRWQLAKRQAGTHSVKTRNQITGTGAKMYRQKGTGRARHGDKKVPQFRGGGKSFGPNVRSHEEGLPKKVRALGLRHALSAKAKDESIMVVDTATAEDNKTKALSARFADLGLANALIIDGAELNTNFQQAARNIKNVDVLPIQGINVYDILRRDTLVLTKSAVEALEERFK